MSILFIVIVLLLLMVGGAAAVFMIRTRKAPKTESSSGTAERKRKANSRRLGYRYMEDSPAFFFIKDRGVWTGVRLDTTTDEFQSMAEQESAVDSNLEPMQALLDYFAAQSGKREASVPCHEIVRNMPPDTSDWSTRYDASHWDPTALFSGLVSDKVEPHIRDAAPVRARYLLIRIGEQKGEVGIDPADRILDADDELCNELFTVQELNSFRNQAAEVLARLADYGTPMDRSDLAWLIRKTLAGTHPVDTTTDYSRTRFARNTWFDELVFFNGENLKQQAAVRIPSPDADDDGVSGSCYTAALTVSTAESRIPFDYWNAWGRVLRRLPNPPEISWRYRLVSERLWKRMLDDATKTIADEVNDRNKNGGEAAVNNPRFAEIAAESAEVREQMALRPQPGMIGQLRIIISAPTLKELARREQEVKDVMKNFVKLERRKNLQYALLEEQLPGDFDTARMGSRVLAKDFRDGGGVDVGTRYTDLEILSMARLDSAPTVGDGIEIENATGQELGWYGHVIGYAAENGAIVHFDPFVPMARNGGAGTAIIGATGGGKSTLALCLFFWLSESGVQTVVLDPKNDFEKFVHYIAFGPQVLEDGFAEAAAAGTLGLPDSPFQPINRQFWDDTKVVSLTTGKSGSMEPWLLTDDFEEGEALARQQIDHLFSDLSPQDPRRNSIELAFTKLRETYKQGVADDPNYPLPRLSQLADQIADDIEYYSGVLDKHAEKIDAKQARDQLITLRKRLERAETQPYARLLFGHSDVDEGSMIRGFTHRRTVITMIGFNPPKSQEEAAVNESARAASAAMFTVLWQVERVFSAAGISISPHRRKKDTRPRALFVDEAYMITAFAAGASLLNRALRQGRSLYFAVIIISQQAKDINRIEEAQSSGDEADKNQFSTVFVFQQKGNAEAQAALKLLRSSTSLDDEDSAMLSHRLLKQRAGGSLSTGVCVMKDADERVATAHIDSLFDELFRACQTNATQRATAQSHPISSDPREWTLNPAVRDRTQFTAVIGGLDDAESEIATRMGFEYGEFDDLAQPA